MPAWSGRLQASYGSGPVSVSDWLVLQSVYEQEGGKAGGGGLGWSRQGVEIIARDAEQKKIFSHPTICRTTLPHTDLHPYSTP